MKFETYTDWGRAMTPEEMEKMDARRAKLLAEGVTYHAHTDRGTTRIREWDTEELANDWVEFANSMDPPPVEIKIVITE